MQLKSFLQTASSTEILIPLNQQNNEQRNRVWSSHIEVERIQRKGTFDTVLNYYFDGEGDGFWYEIPKSKFDQQEQNDFARKEVHSNTSGSIFGETCPESKYVKQFCTMKLDPCEHTDQNRVSYHEYIGVKIHWWLPV